VLIYNFSVLDQSVFAARAHAKLGLGMCDGLPDYKGELPLTFTIFSGILTAGLSSFGVIGNVLTALVLIRKPLKPHVICYSLLSNHL